MLARSRAATSLLCTSELVGRRLEVIPKGTWEILRRCPFSPRELVAATAERKVAVQWPGGLLGSARRRRGSLESTRQVIGDTGGGDRDELFRCPPSVSRCFVVTRPVNICEVVPAARVVPSGRSAALQETIFR